MRKNENLKNLIRASIKIPKDAAKKTHKPSISS